MKFINLFLVSALAMVFAGCAGYQLGNTLPEDVESVSLHVINNTDEPSIEVAVMKALRAELQMDGSLKLQSAEEADAELKVTLNEFKMNALAFDSRRGSLAREYRMVLRAATVLTRSETGEVILESPELLGESEFLYAADLTTAKLGSLPEAAADLARKAVSLITTAW